MRYEINVRDWEKFEKKLNRICRKNEGISYDVAGKGFRKVATSDDCEKFVEVVKIDLYGNFVKGDWEVVAKLDIHDGGNIIIPVDHNHEIPIKFRVSENICEHCMTKRSRNFLYVVFNGKTGEYKQVGSKCLLEYTGINPYFLAAFYSAIAELENMENMFGCGGCELFCDVESAIAKAVNVYRSMGYVRSVENSSNRNVLVNMLFCDWKIADVNHHYSLNIENTRPEDYEKAREIIAFAKSYSPRNDFEHNMAALCACDYVKANNMGFVAYIPVWYEKARENDSFGKINGDDSCDCGYFGEVGKRYRGISVDNFMNVCSFANDYGFTYVYKFKANGSVFVWKTSKYIDPETVSEVSFTVKEHNVYRGKKQTVVTRCAIL